MTTDTKHESKVKASHTPGPWHVSLESVVSRLFGRETLGGNSELIAEIRFLSKKRANARLIASSPNLFAFAARIARMTQDGEEVDGRKFVVENEDAVETLNALIDEARGLVAEAKGLAA